MKHRDIGKLEVRNGAGDRVPLDTLINVKTTSGPAIVNHYNLYPSAEINSIPAPGVSSGQADHYHGEVGGRAALVRDGLRVDRADAAADPGREGFAHQARFPLAVVFVFLVLAAQYESWSLPFAILLIVPMCLLAALIGVNWMKLDNNIFTQIGLVVLIGLAAKNAILIVEFAKQLQDEGKSRVDATVEACACACGRF